MKYIDKINGINYKIKKQIKCHHKINESFSENIDINVIHSL